MDMDIVTDGHHLITPEGQKLPCSMGRSGLVTAERKAEGDGKTPLGRWALTHVLYRPDRGPRPVSGLPIAAISNRDGWCDDPLDPAYNRAVRLPYPASHEALWRTDGLYDLLVVSDHNSTPPVPGLGSAIFLHCRALDDGPTAGCISIARAALAELIAQMVPGVGLKIVERL